jgi:hypothetical protein
MMDPNIAVLLILLGLGAAFGLLAAVFLSERVREFGLLSAVWRSITGGPGHRPHSM